MVHAQQPVECSPRDAVQAKLQRLIDMAVNVDEFDGKIQNGRGESHGFARGVISSREWREISASVAPKDPGRLDQPQ